MSQVKKQAKSATKSKTIIIAVGTFLIGLITFITGTDLWGMLPEGSNATEIVMMIAGGIQFILRFFTEGGITFKK